MEIQSGTLPSCPKKQCSQWVRTYLKYCLCNAKDGVALSFGIVSVISWAVAEVPQIISNYKEKSTEGLSVVFLTTWIIGDVFNVIGCLLEPATLPTQYYTALLYTLTTVILTAQTVYYGHIYHRLKANKFSLVRKSRKTRHEDNSKDENVLQKESETDGSLANGSNPVITTSSPISVVAPLSHHYGSYGRDFYYISARSLSKSPKPTAGSWLAHAQDSGRAPLREPLISSLAPTQSLPPLNTKNMLSVVFSAVFFVGIYIIRLSENSVVRASPTGMVILMGRKLLQDETVELMVQEGSGSSGLGSFLGWAMAAIYMGGRLPQIFLNMRRGNAEGLSPLMFFFALIGNITYVGSILVKSMEWSRIRPNLPWLVDAAGCVLLDTFILIQFIYFRYLKPKDFE